MAGRVSVRVIKQKWGEGYDVVEGEVDAEKRGGEFNDAVVWSTGVAQSV